MGEGLRPSPFRLGQRPSAIEEQLAIEQRLT